MSLQQIVYRTSPALHAQLSERAVAWDVSKHEAARRLAVLATFNLSTDDHRRVAQLAESMGGSFACAAAALSEIAQEMKS